MSFLSSINSLWSSVFSPRDFDRTTSRPPPTPTGKVASYVSSRDRREIVDRMLKGIANVPVVAAVQSRIIDQAVGTGGILSFSGSGDAEMDKVFSDVLAGWSEKPEVGGRLTLNGLQRLDMSARMATGELFCIIHKRGAYGLEVQPINSESVEGTIADFPDAEAKGIKEVYDGIAMDEFGVPLYYRLTNGEILKAEDVIHSYDATREANARRGLPYAWTSANPGIQLHSLMADVVGTSKSQSRFAFFRTGRKPKIAGGRSSRGGVRVAETTGSLDTAEMSSGINTQLPGGGLFMDIGEGEDIKVAQVGNPEGALKVLLILMEQVCLAYGWASDLILRPGAIGGTATRGVFVQAEKSILQLQMPMVRMTKQLGVRVLAAAEQKGLLGNYKLPLGYDRFIQVQLPSTLSVDYARDGKADILRLDNRLTTRKALCQADGTDEDAIEQENIANLERLLKRLAEKGIPYDIYVKAQAGAAPTTNPDEVKEDERAAA